MKILSAEEWYYNQLSKQSGKTMTNFQIAENYSKYLLEKQAEFLCNESFKEIGNLLSNKEITELSNEFIKLLSNEN
jgi:hypothetical protein